MRTKRRLRKKRTVDSDELKGKVPVRAKKRTRKAKTTDELPKHYKTERQRRAERKVTKAPKEVRKVKRTTYKRKKCMFVKANGERCGKWAVGRSTLCELHGGEMYVPETSTPLNTELSSNTKFDPSVHPMAFIELSREGQSEKEIAANFMIRPETIKNWADTYKEFATAYEVGKALHEAWWLAKGKEGLDDYRFNTSLYKFLTGNLLGYSDKIEQKNLNATMHGVLVVPDKMGFDEWEAHAQATIHNSNT